MPAGQVGAGRRRRKAGHQEVGGDIVGGGEDEGGEGDAVGHQDEGEEPPSAWTNSSKLII